MKVIISASNDQITGPFNPRFGRADYFIAVDSETGSWESLSNPAVGASGGAGPQAVQFLTAYQPDAVISGHFGPKAASALETAGIPAYLASSGSVQDVLDQFVAGSLSAADGGAGRGQGRGLGRGGRR